MVDGERGSPAGGSGATSSAPARGSAALLPSVELPTGGGAIRATSDKFAVDAVTGGGSLAVPLALPDGRGGFGPNLTLRYDSNTGNGVFGLGWSLGLPEIARKTDKGLPLYDDAADSDVFVLSGSEDLVPVVRPAGGHPDEGGDRTPWGRDERTVGDHLVRGYRPRVEGQFARIERWTRVADPADVHWRSISRDDVLTVYGADASSRVFDPADPTRIFRWLACQTRDDRGNVVVYDHVADDATGVDPASPAQRTEWPDEGARPGAGPAHGAQRHLKRVRYGNLTPLLDDDGRRPRAVDRTDLDAMEWMFEAVLDYGDHDDEAPAPGIARPWELRPDPYSWHRAGFEVRTSRRCRRVLTFHHFPDEPGIGADCLVGSTELDYGPPVELTTSTTSGYSTLRRVTRVCYRRDGEGYRRRELPPTELGYTEPALGGDVVLVPRDDVAGLPLGAGTEDYRWVDLRGDGTTGILTETAGGAWLYAPNLSAASLGARAPGERTDGASSAPAQVRFGALEPVAEQPTVALGDGAQLMDLTGDGRLDLVTLQGPMPGVWAQVDDADWAPFHAFDHDLLVAWEDPSLRLVDLTGDGLADVIEVDGDGVTWGRALGCDGFGPLRTVPVAGDEHIGPRVVLTDAREAVLFADMTGDGLPDIVRVRNGSVRYWSNHGYGRFGRARDLGNVSLFDETDGFDPDRLRVADIDGSGTADLIYLHRSGPRVYLNQSGNALSPPHVLDGLPGHDDESTMDVLDLLGNGTSCLVWSSRSGGDRVALRYVDLMGGKPHLLATLSNGLGSETRLCYLPSTTYYLEDQAAGRPWTTRSAFAVHVVARVEQVDRISGVRTCTRYAYHDLCFDAEEREPRGFAMVEQWDTDDLPTPRGPRRTAPVHARTWFHTGLPPRAGRHRGDRPPPTGPPGSSLPPPALPDGLDPQEEREAYRSLHGMLLRREVRGLDDTPRAAHPYLVEEQALAVRRLQPRHADSPAVFLGYPRESLTSHVERDPDDPRVEHALTLAIDEYGTVLDEVAVAYGRRRPDERLPLDRDRAVQATALVTRRLCRMTPAVDDDDHYRAPLAADARTLEVLDPPTPPGRLLTVADWAGRDPATGTRLVQQTIDLYRPDDLGTSAGDPTALLPWRAIESHALHGLTLHRTFDEDTLARLLTRDGEPLLEDLPGTLIEGGYRRGGDLVAAGLAPADAVGEAESWWLPSSRAFLSPGRSDDARTEHAYAVRHFFAPLRVRDPFQDGTGADSLAVLDRYDLVTVETIDPLGNRTTVGERSGGRPSGRPAVDYRLLKPTLVTDPNGNRAEVAFDTLGMLVATAVMGKVGEGLGDSLAGLDADVDPATDPAGGPAIDPAEDGAAVLGTATRRLSYDLFAYRRTRDDAVPTPCSVRTVVREKHASDLAPGETARTQTGFSWADGSGREIQRKQQADPATPGGPAQWVTTGWSVLDDKGRVVRRYEPFLSPRWTFEDDARHGVSTVSVHDPVGRVVATLDADGGWSKVVLTAWGRATWDRNDTVLDDPRVDPDVGGLVARLLTGADHRTWYEQRTSGERGAAEEEAAARSAAHARTPTTEHVDPLGRSVLTVRDTGTQRLATRAELDVAGRRLVLRDAWTEDDPAGRVVERSAYDLAGRAVSVRAMDAGRRWSLVDAVDQPLRSWDDRGHRTRVVRDALRRPLEVRVTGVDPADADREVVMERTGYGESLPDAERHNLRTRAYVQLDQAGRSLTEAYDFKGNVLSGTRHVARDHRMLCDWSLSTVVDTLESPRPSGSGGDHGSALARAAQEHLDPHRYRVSTSYDALNQSLVTSLPHAEGSAPTSVRQTYTTTRRVRTAEVDVPRAGDGAPTSIAVLDEVVYDAHGRRTRMRRGNGVETEWTYDPLSQRLLRVVTRRTGRRRALQDLGYTYDAVGNIVAVSDAAPPRFFRNQAVRAGSEFRYDALYRLVEATGREQLSGAGGGPRPPGAADLPLEPHPEDGLPMARYRERYIYDAAGNLLRTEHRGSDPARRGWTREHHHEQVRDPASGDTLVGNRLGSAVVEAERPLTEDFAYDAHGNTVAMPHVPRLEWDFRDQLRRGESQRVVRLGVSASTTWYAHDASGERVRKVRERGDGTVVEERIRVGGFEALHHHGGGLDGLVRESVDVVVDGESVARVETRNEVDDGSRPFLLRHQLRDHLGSGAVELDGAGRVITVEGYTPYGASAYRAVRAETQGTRADRFLGKPRDDETGLIVVGARCYAPWLGRWVSCDPAGHATGTNRYQYAGSDPVNRRDTNGRWDISWRDVAIGAGVAVLTVAAAAAVVVTVGAAAPGIVAGTAALIGVSETTLVTGAVVAGTAVGVAGTVNTANEVATGRTVDGRALTDQERSRRLGALPVEAVATVFGMRGINMGGGAGPTAMAESLSVGADGAAALRPSFGWSMPTIGSITADAEALRPALTGAMSSTVMAMTGAGGGGSTPPEQPSSSQPPPEETTSSSSPPESPPEAATEPPPESATTPDAMYTGPARMGSSTSTSYRETFFTANPEARGKVWVHHAVERQAAEVRYPGEVSQSELHSLENLRGIPNEINPDVHLSKIRKLWNEFYRLNPNATQQDLLDQATKIDDMFGACFMPPVRPPVTSGGQ